MTQTIVSVCLAAVAGVRGVLKVGGAGPVVPQQLRACRQLLHGLEPQHQPSPFVEKLVH